jgi:hypothetical protein
MRPEPPLVPLALHRYRPTTARPPDRANVGGDLDMSLVEPALAGEVELQLRGLGAATAHLVAVRPPLPQQRVALVVVEDRQQPRIAV